MNGEKFDFSEKVIETGNKLFQNFLEVQRIMRKSFLSNTYDHTQHFNNTREELLEVFEAFDIAWTSYEKIYVQELMVIEQEARRFITDAIETEKRLSEYQSKQTPDVFKRDDDAVDRYRDELAQQFAKLNSVANVDGHGRDDLDYEILRAADRMLREVSPSESESIRKLARNIKKSFESLRDLLRRYDENIEVVDPQLRNNQELVLELVNYEKSWEKGKIYFLDKNRCSQLIYFSNVLEGLSEKYDTFKEQIESFDAEVFVIIPMIMVLRKIDGEDRGICEHFLPQLNKKEDPMYLEYMRLKDTLFEVNQRVLSKKQTPKSDMTRKSVFETNLLNTNKMKTLLKSQKNLSLVSTQKFKKLIPELYNTIEKIIIYNDNVDEYLKESGFMNEKGDILKSLKILKSLSIELQRQNPSDWNEFMDVALDNKQLSA